MLYPRFAADSFWSFAESCKLMGVRRPAPLLGLITVAAMLPGSWTVRVDCNTASIADDDFAWADLVFTGGMLPQQADTRRLIEVCRSRASAAEWAPSTASKADLEQRMFDVRCSKADLHRRDGDVRFANGRHCRFTRSPRQRARARTAARGKSRAFAVLRLMTSSYLVGACTGRSAGFSPLRMRST